MLKTVVLALFIIVATNAFATIDCHEGDRLYIQVIEMEKDGTKVLLLGMEHFGPKGYFKRASRLMDSWSASEKTSILTEFFTCSKESQKCALDPDGKTLRPRGSAEQYKANCDKAQKIGIECQWKDFKYPESRSIEIVAGDLVFDEESPENQTTIERLFASKSDSDKKSDTNDNQFIYQYRNQRLIAKALAKSESSKRIIIPWGSGHVEGLKSLLVAKGFHQSNALDVEYMGKEDFETFKKWPSMNDFYKRRFEKSVPRSGNCRPLDSGTAKEKPAETFR